MLVSNDAHEADLIDAIYELALDATAFDNFILTWEAYLQQRGERIEIMSDQSAPLKTLKCPITYINGELDGLTSIDTVQAFCDDLPRAQVIRIQKMGNLFFYSSPQLLLHSLKTIF